MLFLDVIYVDGSKGAWFCWVKASLNTTNRYATIDLEMKRKAIKLLESSADVKAGTWKTDGTGLGWLDSLK